MFSPQPYSDFSMREPLRSAQCTHTLERQQWEASTASTPELVVELVNLIEKSKEGWDENIYYLIMS